MYRLLVIAATVLPAPGFAAPNWVEFDATPESANPYARNVYYVDSSSTGSKTLGDLTYWVVDVKSVNQMSNTSLYEQLAVVCTGTPIAPAIAHMKLGKISVEGDPIVELDFGYPESIDRFSLENLDRQAAGPFAALARFVCDRKANDGESS